MQYFVGFIIGLAAGGLMVFITTRFNRKDIEQSFSALSLNALSKNSEEFLKLASVSLNSQSQAGTGELESKKKLIDQTLETMRTELLKVETSLKDFDSKRQESFGKVSEQLKNTAEKTKELETTTNKLQNALSNTKVRGQWGERMAEDVLTLAGFGEGINYLKQKTQGSLESRPDFTFLLPQGLRLNMDVKFPHNNYDRYVNEENDAVKETLKLQFLKDVRQRIKEVTTREYIDPQGKTLDYVLVFVPNEQIYCFINENDSTILDSAMRDKVIICSPLTLYAILAVIRQAVDSFNLSRSNSQMISLLGEFSKQWQEFKKSMDSVGKKIESAADEFQKLKSTRTNMLEKPLKGIEKLRSQQAEGDSLIAGILPFIESQGLEEQHGVEFLDE